MKVLDIQNIRKQKNISQEELAHSSNLTVRTIQRIEKGDSIPRANTLKQIADAFSISVEELYLEQARHNVIEDKNKIQLLKLSQFLFPFYFLGIIAPTIIKYSNKEPSTEFTLWSNEIINFQFTWLITTILTVIFAFSGVLNVLWLLCLVILSVKLEVFKDVKFLNQKPILQSCLLIASYLIIVQIFGFIGSFLILAGLNVFVIIQSLSAKSFKNLNPLPIKLSILK